MKKLYWLRLLRTSLLAVLLIQPVSAVFASGANAQTTLNASAVVVPVHVARLGFSISAIAREVPVKEGDTVKTGQTLMVLDTPELQFAVTEAQAALHSAQAYADLQKYRKVKNQRNGRIFFDTVLEESRQLAEIKVQQAQVALEIAQFNLTQSVLTAPFEGTVASINVIPGEFVPSDQAIVTLATLNAFQVETTNLNEGDITRVRIGAPVDIFVEAINQDLHGKVSAISPKADRVGGDAVFKVTIAFDQQPQNLLWGMTAKVKIEK